MSTITLILSDFRAFQIIRFVKTTPFYLKNTCLFIVLGILISCSANDKESNNEQSDFQNFACAIINEQPRFLIGGCAYVIAGNVIES